MSRKFKIYLYCLLIAICSHYDLIAAILGITLWVIYEFLTERKAEK